MYQGKEYVVHVFSVSRWTHEAYGKEGQPVQWATRDIVAALDCTPSTHVALPHLPLYMPPDFWSQQIAATDGLGEQAFDGILALAMRQCLSSMAAARVMWCEFAPLGVSTEWSQDVGSHRLLMHVAVDCGALPPWRVLSHGNSMALYRAATTDCHAFAVSGLDGPLAVFDALSFSMAAPWVDRVSSPPAAAFRSELDARGAGEFAVVLTAATTTHAIRLCTHPDLIHYRTLRCISAATRVQRAVRLLHLANRRGGGRDITPLLVNRDVGFAYDGRHHAAVVRIHRCWLRFRSRKSSRVRRSSINETPSDENLADKNRTEDSTGRDGPSQSSLQPRPTQGSTGVGLPSYVGVTPDHLRDKWQQAPSGPQPVALFYQDAVPISDNFIFSNWYVSQAEFTFEFPDWLLELRGQWLDSIAAPRSFQVKCGEVPLMLCKAALMEDSLRLDAIAKASSPREAKHLGRQVDNFQQSLWDNHVCAVAVAVVRARVAQIPELRARLIPMAGEYVAEATSRDLNFGIGWSATAPEAKQPLLWRGSNILGWAYMQVSSELDEGGLAPALKRVQDNEAGTSSDDLSNRPTVGEVRKAFDTHGARCVEALSDTDMGSDDDSSSESDVPHATRLSDELRVLLYLSAMLPQQTVQTEEEVLQQDLHNDDAEVWREHFRHESVREHSRRQQMAELHSIQMANILSARLTALSRSDLGRALVGSVQNTIQAGGAHFTPCYFRKAAYRSSARNENGEAHLRKLKNLMLDLGAAISVMDIGTALELERRGAASVIRRLHAKAVEARVVGGGHIRCVGTARVEFNLQNEATGEWHSYVEKFQLIEGPATCILGNTFHARNGCLVNLEEGFASYKLKDGSRFTTPVDAQSPGALIAAMATSEPIAYLDSDHVMPGGGGFLMAKLKVPRTFAGQKVHITPLRGENSGYLKTANITLSECNYMVEDDGSVIIPLFGHDHRDRQLPSMTAMAHYSLATNFEQKEMQCTDEETCAIVDALKIHAADEEELKVKKFNVKCAIVWGREGMFNDKVLGEHAFGEFHVDTPEVDNGNKAPPNIPSRPLNQEQYDAARKQWQEMVDQGMLVPSKSPWGAPIVMVRKPNGRGWRMCLDYRAGNAVAVKQHYPLPLVQDTLDKIGNAKFFTSLDCLKAFWQIRNSPETQPKTAINFPWGKFECTRMPMGMQAASATFQRIMDVMIRDIDFCVGFVDDILIFSHTWEDHLAHVACVLDRVGGAGLVFDPSKCEIGKSSTKFLGVIVAADGNRPDPDKISTVKDAEFPPDRKTMHSWVALLNYYARHIPEFAIITTPLQAYIHEKPHKDKNGKFVWHPASQEVRDAFDKLKAALVGDLVLARPDYTKQFILTVDAAKKIGGAGAILSQINDEGRDCPIAYWSVRWIDSAANWSPVEHECYAFRRATEQFSDYLSGAKFQVYTDSEPLVWVQSLRRPKGHMAEWILELQSLDFDVAHIPGSANIGSDTLSRLALDQREMQSNRRNIALNQKFFEGDEDSDTLVSASSVSPEAQPKTARPVSGVPKLAPRAKGRDHHWKRRRVCAVLTDGAFTLALTTFNGESSVFPHTRKLYKREVLRDAALRALAEGLHLESTALSPDVRVALGLPVVVRASNTVYSVFCCSAQVLQPLLNSCQPASPLLVQWLPCGPAATSLAFQEDAHMFQQLAAALEERLLPQPQHSHEALHALLSGRHDRQLHLTLLNSVTVLDDGRGVPPSLIDTERDALSALRLLAAHLGSVAGTVNAAVVFDFEYDADMFGIDVTQVAAGPYIFVFDTLSFSTVLTAALMYDRDHPDDPAYAVPTLRHWLVDPDTVTIVQAYGGDARMLLRGYDITLASPFDTCAADALINRAQGRNLKALVEDYLPHNHMTAKSAVVHVRGLFKRRPMSKLHFDYCWQDVVDMFALYLAMRARLSELQLALVFSLSVRNGEPPEGPVSRMALVVHDGDRFLLVDGSPLMFSVSPFRLDKSQESVRARVAARKEVRERFTDVLAGAMPRALGAPQLVHNAHVFVATIDPFHFDRILQLEGRADGPNIKDIALWGHTSTSCFQALAAHALVVARLTPASDTVVTSLNVLSRGVIWHFTPDMVNKAIVIQAAARRLLVCRRLRRGRWVSEAEEAYDTVLKTLACLVNATFTPQAPAEALDSLFTSAVTRVPLSRSYVPLDAGHEDVREFTQVMVLVRDEEARCLLLHRNASSPKAREDPALRALPSLRTDAVVYGLHRARHALQLLFGPVRAFPELETMHSGLTLRGMTVTEGGKVNDRCALYEVKVPSLTELAEPLAEAFSYRRCTPTHEALYPGYEVTPMAEAFKELGPTERCALVGYLGDVFPAPSPNISNVTFPRPPLPDPDVQNDATHAEEAPTQRQRKLAPGEQPSGADLQESNSQAHYEPGSFIPKVANPLEFMQELVGGELLSPLKEIAAAQMDDPECQAIRAWEQSRLEPGGAKDDVPPLLRKLHRSYSKRSFREVNGVLHALDDSGATSSDGRPQLRIYLPQAMRSKVVIGLHDSFGHPGIKRTLRVVNSRVWWPFMKVTITEILAECPTCLFNKESPHRGEQHIPENGSHMWHSWQMDLVHLHKARSGKEKALVFYDRFGRDVEAFATTAECNTDDVLNVILFGMIPRHGWPRVIYVDRGSNFISEKAKEWFERMGIELRAADSHMHTAVAGCERFNHTLREIARAAHFDHGFEWDVMLPLIVFWYRQLVQTATGFSPFYMDHGRDAVSPWDVGKGPSPSTIHADSMAEGLRQHFAALHLAWQCSRTDIALREREQQKLHSKRYQTNVTFAVNQRVLIRQAGRKSKMHMPYVGPFRIEAVLERDRYRVVGRRNAKRDHHEFHVSRLKLWPEGADDEDIYITEQYYDVDRVIGHKKGKKADGGLLYRVRWVGYGAADDEWIAFKDMNGPCARAALDYLQSLDDSKAGEDEGAPGLSPSLVPDAAPTAQEEAKPLPLVHDNVDTTSSTHTEDREARKKAREEAKERRLQAAL